ncbi:MAG: c-type cytochrome [Cyanobacteria bacterium J06626_18]
MRSHWLWAGCLISLLCLWLTFVPTAMAAEPLPLSSMQANAQELFTVQCAGCHPNGGNVIRRGKNLKLRALERHNVASVEAITALITNGKGLMSAYSDRLTSEEIEVLATYVWNQAQNDWH